MDYVWLILAIATQAGCNLSFKAGTLRVGQSPQKLSGLPGFVRRTFSNPFVIFGVVLNIMFVPAYAFAISAFALSYVYALVAAIPLVLIALFSLVLFREKISRMTWLGIAAICVGVVLLGIAVG